MNEFIFKGFINGIEKTAVSANWIYQRMLGAKRSGIKPIKISNYIQNVIAKRQGVTKEKVLDFVHKSIAKGRRFAMPKKFGRQLVPTLNAAQKALDKFNKRWTRG